MQVLKENKSLEIQKEIMNNKLSALDKLWLETRKNISNELNDKIIEIKSTSKNHHKEANFRDIKLISLLINLIGFLVTLLFPVFLALYLLLIVSTVILLIYSKPDTSYKSKIAEENIKFNKKKKDFEYIYLNNKNQLEDELELVQKGLEGEEIVQNYIQRYFNDEYILLNDIVIKSKYSNPTQIDHLLLSNGAIYALETKNMHGLFYPNGHTWKRFNNFESNSNENGILIDNPQEQSIYHAKKLKEILIEHNFNIDIVPIVILTHPNAVWKGNSTKSCPVLNLNDLSLILNFPEENVLNEEDKKKLVHLLLAQNQKYSSYFYDNLNRRQE